MKILKQLISMSASGFLSKRIDFVTYTIGKIVRFILFLALIFGIFNFTQTLAGYGEYEVIFFFLTFHLIDVLAQVAFRGVYHFVPDIKLGNFDFVLSKPVNSLFYVLMKAVDISDTIFLVPVLGVLIFSFLKLTLFISFSAIMFYFLMLTMSLITITAIHIFVVALTVLTSENDNFIWFYRESMNVGRFPPDIFPTSIQAVFTYVIPVIIVFAFPVKIFLGSLSWQWMLFGFVYAVIFFALSLIIWKKALKKYSSASS